MKVLYHLVEKVPYLSEAEHDAELDLLRLVEKDLGLGGIVPPATGSINAPIAPVPAVAVPGPVAEPVPAAQQPLPVTSPELVGAAPEQTNAFAPTFAPK